MKYDEYLKNYFKVQMESEMIDVDRYENGVSIATTTKHYPRSQNRYIQINSTLLIPEKFYEKFREKIILHRGVRQYIAHLLYKYKIHIANGLVPSYSNHTTKYQEKNQNLIKVTFRPNLDDWAELKLYRVSFGMSISAFLVYLLIADFEKTVFHYLRIVGIPQSPEFDLWAKVYLSRKKLLYTTIFQYRERPYG